MTVRTLLILVVVSIALDGCRIEPAAESPQKSAPEPMSYVEPRPGAASLCMITTRTQNGTITKATNCFLIPFDGVEHVVNSGRQLGYQTRINQTITIAYIDAGMRMAARLSSFPDRPDTLVAELAYQDNRVVQQLGIPFQITEGALIDTVQCKGVWLLTNGKQRLLYEWRQRVRGMSVSLRLEAKLLWNDPEPALPSALSKMNATSEVALSFVTATAERSRKHTVACDWADLGNDDAGRPRGLTCTAQFGKQIPFVTNLGGTKVIQYLDMTSGVTIDRYLSAGTHLAYFDRGLEAATDLSKPDLTQSRATTGDFRFPARVTEAKDVPLSSTGNPDGVVTTLERFQQHALFRSD